jgi:hypothetical protein
MLVLVIEKSVTKIYYERHIPCMREMRNAYKIVVERPEGRRRPL